MNLYVRRLIGPALIAAWAGALPATAQAPRAAGQTYVYRLTVAKDISTDYSSLPASMRGQAQAIQSAGNKTPTIYVLTLATDRVNADGSAHVNVGFTNSMENRGSAATYAGFNQFEGSLGADGRFMPQYDPNMHLTVGARGMSPPEEIHNQKAQEMTNFFADFNTFAGGCAKRGQIKTGDMWRVTSKDQYANSRTYDFAATGAAGSVAAVTMKGDFASPTGASSLYATGHYDVARRLVLDLHATNTFKNTTPAGISSNGTATMDYDLQ